MAKPKLRTEEIEDLYRRNVTVIETEYGEKYSNIPEKDFDSLMELYDFLPHEKLQNPNWNFVFNIEWRIYTKWCMSNRDKFHGFYDVEGFTEFVRDETHHE